MTIAACYVSSEGVVLGADSMTVRYANVAQYFMGQKIFEIGKNSNLGLMTWGHAGFPPAPSHRQLYSQLADSLHDNPVASVEEAAIRWRGLFWEQYQLALAEQIAQAQALHAVENRNNAQEQEYQELITHYYTGFCIGGTFPPQYVPTAFHFTVRPTQAEPPALEAIPTGETRFFGCGRIMERFVHGFDRNLFRAILDSEHWDGTEDNLHETSAPHHIALRVFDLPLREAVDLVHSAILLTIKLTKFYEWDVRCSGPIEIAVLPADEAFCWVRHNNYGDSLDER